MCKKGETIILFFNFLVRRATLRELTPLAPLKCDATRWSSVEVMLKRYNALQEHLKNLDMDGLDNLILSKKEDQELESFSIKHKKSEVNHLETTSFKVIEFTFLIQYTVEL